MMIHSCFPPLDEAQDVCFWFVQLSKEKKTGREREIGKRGEREINREKREGAGEKIKGKRENRIRKGKRIREKMRKKRENVNVDSGHLFAMIYA